MERMINNPINFPKVTCTIETTCGTSILEVEWDHSSMGGIHIDRLFKNSYVITWNVGFPRGGRGDHGRGRIVVTNGSIDYEHEPKTVFTRGFGFLRILVDRKVLFLFNRPRP